MKDAGADREFFRDVLKFSSVDAGGVWLILPRLRWKRRFMRSGKIWSEAADGRGSTHTGVTPNSRLDWVRHVFDHPGVLAADSSPR